MKKAEKFGAVVNLPEHKRMVRLVYKPEVPQPKPAAPPAVKPAVVTQKESAITLAPNLHRNQTRWQ